jgi:hypothetical protein
VTPCSGAGRKFGTIALLIPSLRRRQISQVLSLSEGTRVPDEVIVIDNDPIPQPALGQSRASAS